MTLTRFFFILLLATLSFNPTAFAHDDQNTPVHSGNKKVSVTLKGHINRSMMLADNGFHTRVLHVDNDSSSTRLGAHALATFSPTLKMGANMVLELQSNNSEVIDIFDNQRGVNFKQRITEIFFDSAHYGKLSVGYGATFSDTTSENDLSGTDMVGLGASVDSFAGGLRFREFGAVAGPQIIDVHEGMDGLTKDNRVRYDSPTFYGFSIGGSHITQNSVDGGINFSGNVGDTQIQASAVILRKAKTYSQVSGSAAFLFKNGISLSVAAGRRFSVHNSTRNPFMYHGKLGYSCEALSFGKTHMAVDFGAARDLAQKEDRACSPGAFLVQDLDDVATELYLGFRTHHLKRPGSKFRRINAGMIGARVRF